MKQFKVSVLTREYLSEPVSVSGPGIDLTLTDVWLCLKPRGVNPSTGDWVAALWYTDPITGETSARAKLGDDLPLTQGIFVAWLKLNLGDEQPVRDFAVLYVE